MSFDVEVIDGHCHLASTRCIPRAFMDGVVSNMAVKLEAGGMSTDREKLLRILESQYQDHEGDRLVEQMDRAGIKQTVLLAPDFTYVFDSNFDIKQIALQHAEVRKKHPGRFFVFLGVDPRWGDAGYRFFESSVKEHGFEGLKIYPPCGFSPSDERMYPLYEICASYGLPALLHTGPTTPTLDFEHAMPYRIDKAAKNFPGVNFILAHGGANFVEQARLMCTYRPNVYLDISGFQNIMSAGGWRAHLAQLFNQGINHKIIFGTDWPVFSMKDELHNTVNALLDGEGPFQGQSRRAVADIMGNTMKKLLPA